METVGVWSGGEDLARRLAGRLTGPYRIFRASHPAELARANCTGLIIAPDAVGLAGAGVIRPRLALLPGDSIALAHGVQAASAVSYGLGHQNTLTLSSLDGGSVSVCLQRELITLSGRTVERQEWVLPFDRNQQTPEEFLCLCGALLALDQGLG